MQFRVRCVQGRSEDRCCQAQFPARGRAGTAETGCAGTHSSYSCGRASESGTAAALLSEPACFPVPGNIRRLR